ncbi:MAG: HAMP domain-containing histidine kinase, partial [Anaerolineae bacterium]|nr:HAMP domain-containing histidine kinase [Anaerolineae bacterium]
MSRRQLSLDFEVDDQLAEKLIHTGLLDNPEHWFQTRTTYSDTVAGYLRFIKHEVSSDLTSMLGYASLLRRIELSPQQQKIFLASIEKSCQSFQKIITDLTEVEIFEAEGAYFKLAPVDFNKILQESLEALQPSIDEKNQQILVEKNSLPPVLSTHYHLSRLLEILLMNASLYTLPEGTIEITAHVVDQHLHITIRDNGIGIEQAEIERVFEKFYRSQDETVQEQSGLGLGLTIARHITNGHGGKIWLESETGIGTSAHVLLPILA